MNYHIVRNTTSCFPAPQRLATITRRIQISVLLYKCTVRPLEALLSKPPSKLHTTLLISHRLLLGNTYNLSTGEIDEKLEAEAKEKEAKEKEATEAEERLIRAATLRKKRSGGPRSQR